MAIYQPHVVPLKVLLHGEGAGDQDIPDAGIDGVLPTALFRRAFISYSDRFAVLEPR
jgi:hypothetical protein